MKKSNWIIIFFISVIILGFSFVISNDQNTDSQKKTIIFNKKDLSYTIPLDIETVILNSNSLKEVPQQISNFKNLIKIELADNKLEVIPSYFNDFKNLKRLNISENKHLNLKESLKNLNQTKIDDLDISNCDLLYIPHTISELTSLEKLDASNNYIFELPVLFNELENLKYLNLSYNEIDSIGYSLHRLKKLEYINLEGNKNLNIENLMINLIPLKNIKTLLLSDLKGFLPNIFGKIKTQELYISNSNINNFPTNDKNLQVKSIIFENCEASNFNLIFENLSENENLKELHIHHSLNKLPENIEKLNQLVILDLSNNNLKTLDLKKEDFPKLKKIALQNNQFSNEEWLKIRENFKGIEIVSDAYMPGSAFNDLKTKTNKISPFFKDKNIPYKTYKTSNSVEKNLTYGNTKIKIPKNAFLNKKGEIINEEIIVEYREFRDPVDILIAGIPMNYDSAGFNGNFESGGMFELNAKTVTDDEVFPNPNSLIQVDFNSTSTDNNFNNYFFNKFNNKWEFSRKNQNKSSEKIDVINFPIELKVMNEIFRNLKPRLEYYPEMNLIFNFHKNITSIYISYKNDEIFTQKEKDFLITRSNKYNLLIPSYINRNKNFIFYNQLKKDELYTQIYDYYTNSSNINRSQDDGKKKKKKNQLTYLNLQFLQIIDFNLGVDRERDCFIATFILPDKVLEIPIILGKSRGNSTNQATKMTLENYNKFWKFYQKSLTSVNSKYNNKTKGLYKKSMDEYENKIIEQETKIREKINEEKKDDELDENVSSFILDNFGIWNIDRLGKIKNKKESTVNFINKTKKVFPIVMLFLLDLTANGVLTFGNNRIAFEKNNKIALLGVNSDGDFMVINSNEFQKHKNVSEFEYAGDIISKNSISIEELKSILK